MTETPRFRQYQSAIVAECDKAGSIRGDRPYLYGTVTEVKPWSVSVRFGNGGTWLFLLDSRGRAWRESGRLQLVPACCRCEFPVLREPATAEDDPMGRAFCSEECLADEAERTRGCHKIAARKEDR
jgi:hypothetical protein